MKPLPAHRINQKVKSQSAVSGSMVLAAVALANRQRRWGFQNKRTGHRLYAQFKTETREIISALWASSPPDLISYVPWSISDTEKGALSKTAETGGPGFLDKYANALCKIREDKSAQVGEIEFFRIGS